MPDLEFTVQSFTANELAIKVKNTSGTSLDKTLAIELYPPTSLVSAAVNDAAVKAASNETPPGAMRLDDVVNGPQGWSVWARRESSDSTPIIVLINDRDQQTGEQLSDPIKFAAAAESIIRIPLNPQTKQDNIDLTYSYAHDDPEDRVDGKLQLKSTQEKDLPVVTLTSDAKNPTMITPGDLVKITWKIPDGVSAILRGPLPGDNSELSLSSDPTADFKIAGGSLSVRVVGLMNYVLQAEVKREGKPNVQIVKMLTLDTANKKHIYIGPRQGKVLPFGLIEMDWAAWGVPQVIITAGDTTRVIKLTQQTFGGSFEGSGVMRVSAGKTGPETILIEAKPESRSKHVLVTSWQHMTKPEVAGQPVGLAVSAPKIALLTTDGLYIADVGKLDPSPALKKLMFVKKTADASTEWFALTTLGNRFFCLKRNGHDTEVVAFAIDGTPETIPPLTLHTDLSRIAILPRAAIDLVGFGNRIYVVADLPPRGGDYGGRRAYSISFDWTNKKAAYRPEPALDNLAGFRLVTFDDALYALNRETGQMFRFELTRAGTLGPPLHAASAVRKENGQEKSMIRDGLFVPVGRVLVVLSPTAVPTLDSLEEYDLHNVLSYESTASADGSVPQDLVYNPQKNYWARCGHDLDVKRSAVAAFRDGDSPRLWVIQPDGETYTLPVGSESLFVRDYVLDFPTKPLSPYLNKKRKFTIKGFSAVGPLDVKYRKYLITDVETNGPRDVSPLPARPQVQFEVEVGYHAADPAYVKLRSQLVRRPQQRADVDYLQEVTFSGEDLSTAISHVVRASMVGDKFSYDNVSMMEHSTDGVIEVPRPKRFDENLRFVIVNASEKFRLKPDRVLPGAPAFIIDEGFFPINHDTPDFSLKADGHVATEGVIGVHLNFALEHGIEASSSKQQQTKMIRLATENAQKLEVLLVKMLMPGDPPLQLKGTKQLIEPMADRPVLVCHIDYKM